MIDIVIDVKGGNKSSHGNDKKFHVMTLLRKAVEIVKGKTTNVKGIKNKLVDTFSIIWEPPKDPREKEATMKSWNSLAITCIFGSISGILASITYFFKHNEELKEAMSRMSSIIVLILLTLIFAFSIVLFVITKTNSCSDRLIKIANIIEGLLLLLLILIVATVAHIAGMLFLFLCTVVATGVIVGILFCAIPRKDPPSSTSYATSTIPHEDPPEITSCATSTIPREDPR